jgi:hypothetical protein
MLCVQLRMAVAWAQGVAEHSSGAQHLSVPLLSVEGHPKGTHCSQETFYDVSPPYEPFVGS